MKRKYWKTKWQTKDGSVIKIKDMDDDHLGHTIRMLRRGADGILFSHFCVLDHMRSTLNGQGSHMLIDSAEWELGEMTDDELLSEHYPPFKAMIDEAIKRQLEV